MLNYTLVDKNFVIPELIVKNEYFEILIELYKRTYERSKIYCSNVYVVKYTGIKYECQIECVDNIFYETDLCGTKKKIDIDLSYIIVDHQNKKLFKKEENSVLKTSEENNKKKEMEIIINQKDVKNVILEKSDEKNEEIKLEIVETNIKNSEEERKKKDEKEKKREEILKMCEQVMDLYHLELNKIKKIELNLKSLNSKLERLKNKKREKIFSEISRTKNEYETWKKLKYTRPKENRELIKKDETELEERSELQIPILFEAKYNYIDNLMNNPNIKSIYKELNKYNLEEIFINEEINIDERIIKFVEKYTKISKKELHYGFDHDWDYLESELGPEGKLVEGHFPN